MAAEKLSLRKAKRLISEKDIEIGRLNKIIEFQNRQLKVARIDGLTGLMRRESFEEQVKKELSRSKRNKEPLTVCVVDLNNLKKVNDVYGHPAGDQMIKGFAKLLEHSVREGDLVARTGGDEFMLLLFRQNSMNAIFAKNRLLEKIDEGKESFAYFFGAAIGCASTDQGFLDFESLYKAADVDMYKHKQELKKAAA